MKDKKMEDRKKTARREEGEVRTEEKKEGKVIKGRMN